MLKSDLYSELLALLNIRTADCRREQGQPVGGNMYNALYHNTGLPELCTDTKTQSLMVQNFDKSINKLRFFFSYLERCMEILFMQL